MSGKPADRVVDLTVDGLATYRLVKLIRDDRITEPLRGKVEEQQGPPERSTITYLLNCSTTEEHQMTSLADQDTRSLGGNVERVEPPAARSRSPGRTA